MNLSMKTLLPDLTPTAHCDGGVVDVAEGAGAAGQGGDGVALQVVQVVRDQEVKSQAYTYQDDKNPNRAPLLSSILTESKFNPYLKGAHLPTYW